MKAEAYSPGHITGFFLIFPNGSTGAGINIEDGVVTAAEAEKSKKARIEIRINGKKSNAETSRNVIKKYLGLKKGTYSISVNHKASLPIGYGLGLSGAGALSLSIALNKALEAKLPKGKIVRIAKEAEIEAGTGLGDVIAEQFLGMMVGKKPYPSKKVHKIPIREQYVAMGFFGSISTKRIIRSREWKNKINSVGGKCMREINKNKSLHNFIMLSRQFALGAKLPNKRVRKVLNELPYAMQAMLGQTVFIITGNPAREKKELLKYAKRVAVSRIAEKGAHLL